MRIRVELIQDDSLGVRSVIGSFRSSGSERSASDAAERIALPIAISRRSGFVRFVRPVRCCS